MATSRDFNENDFNEELFTQEEQYEEGPLRDRKSDFYGGRPSKQPQKKAELVRDVIALANTACIRRSPAYLLMGIDNDGNVQGIDDELLSLEEGATSISQKTIEAAKRAFSDVLNQHIKPTFQTCWDLKVGNVAGKYVAYLRITPRQCDSPYQVDREVREGRNVLLSVGECYIRSGESKRDIRTQDLIRDQWQSLIESPYVLPGQWKRYYEGLLRGSDIKAAQKIDPYIDLHTKEDDTLLDVEVKQFLSDGRTRLLVLQGEAGCGKSTFLRQFVAALAEDGASQMADIIRREEFKSPPGPIPLVLSLRGSGTQVDSKQKLTERLLDKANALGAFWNEQPRRPWGLFERSDLSWLICLDGLDEIWNDDGQRQFLNDALKPFMDRFPRTKLILTSRPFAVEAGFREWNQTKVATIRPLTLNEISQYLMATLSSAAYPDAIDLLESKAQLQQICSHPAHLLAAVQYLGEGYEGKPTDAEEELSSVPEADSQFSVVQDIDTVSRVSEKELREFASALSAELGKSSDEEEDNDVSTDDDVSTDEEEDNLNPIPLGRILKAIYEYLWQRECMRRTYLKENTDEWWERTSKFALERDERNLFRRCSIEKAFSGQTEAFYWLLHLGIVKQAPRRLYAFFTLLTQAYFAAEYVAQLIELGEPADEDPLFVQCTDSFRQRIIALLSDISPYPKH